MEGLLDKENARWQRYLDEARQSMISSARRMDGSFGPRYGIYSFLARNIPMYLYEPRIIPKQKTAFTDGRYIFVNLDFFKLLLKEDLESERAGKRTQSLLPVLWHELAHMLLGHCRRPPVSGSGTDAKVFAFFHTLSHEVAVNTLVAQGLEEQKLLEGPEFAGVIGVSAAARSRFTGLAEPRIARALLDGVLALLEHRISEEILMLVDRKAPALEPGHPPIDVLDALELCRARDKRIERIVRKANERKSGAGFLEAEVPEDARDALSRSVRDGQVDADLLKAGIRACARDRLRRRHADPPPPDALHPDDLAQMLKQLGLLDVMNRLHIRLSDNSDEGERAAKEVANMVMRAVLQAQEDRRNSANPLAYPGGHVLDYALETIRADARPKLRWTHAASDLILGAGAQYRYDHETPIPEFFVPPEQLGTNISPYEGLSIPSEPDSVIIAIVDTSGSVNAGMLKQFLSEILSIREQSAAAPEVLIVYGDTVVRGAPARAEDVAAGNLDVSVYGRGGTNLLQVLSEVLTTTIPEHCPDKRITGVVYLTDLEDTPPLRANLPPALPPVVFIVPDETHVNAEFVAAVNDYAQVMPIREAMEVNLGDGAAGPELSLGP